VTDSKGRTVTFANTIIILTSNLGSAFLLEAAVANSSRPATPELGRPRTPLSVACAPRRAALPLRARGPFACLSGGRQAQPVTAAPSQSPSRLATSTPRGAS
jgi:hypothetical protein